MAPSTTPARKPAARAPRKPAPKAPQDRKKPSEVIQAEALAERPAGADLLRPVISLRSAEQANLQADLMDLFEKLGVDIGEATKAAENGEETPEVELEVTGDTVRGIGEMSTLLEQFVIPESLDEFIVLDTGPGALGRISDLGMWYLTQLGE